MVAGGLAFIQVSHFDVAEIVLRDVLPFSFDIYLKQFSRIEPKDFRFEILGQGRVVELFLESFRNLKPPEGFDLPLWRAIPNGIRSPEKMIFSERHKNLSEQVSADDGFGDDQLTECRAHFHIHIVEFLLLMF